MKPPLTFLLSLTFLFLFSCSPEPEVKREYWNNGNLRKETYHKKGSPNDLISETLYDENGRKWMESWWRYKGALEFITFNKITGEKKQFHRSFSTGNGEEKYTWNILFHENGKKKSYEECHSDVDGFFGKCLVKKWDRNGNQTFGGSMCKNNKCEE